MLGEWLGISEMLNYENIDAMMSLIVTMGAITVPISAWRKSVVHPGYAIGMVVLFFLWWLV